jgi:hypothetical protein
MSPDNLMAVSARIATVAAPHTGVSQSGAEIV